MAYFSSNQTLSVLGSAADKIDVFRRRYNLIKQRLLRHESFKGQVVTANGETRGNAFKLTSVKNLSGSQDASFFILGLLVQGSPGKWFLEDLEAKIELVFEETVSGIFWLTFSLLAPVYSVMVALCSFTVIC